MIVNTVHDEIVVECPEGDAETVKELVLDTMKAAGEYYLKTVPVESEANVGPCWSK